MLRISASMKWLSPLLAVLAVASAPASARAQPVPASDPPYRVEREARQFKLSGAVHEIRVDNPHGDIRIRGSRSNKIEILAVKQIIGEHPVEPTLETAIDALKSRISVRYPHRPKPYYGRIDLVVYLPRQSALLLSTVDSTIEVKGGWQGTIEAKSRSGEISVDGHNRLRLDSDSGRIVAALLEGKRVGDTFIRTRSGSINLSVDKTASIEVNAQSCGTLESLSHSLDSIGKGRCRKARASFSEGAHKAGVRSRSGAVMINAM